MNTMLGGFCDGMVLDVGGASCVLLIAMRFQIGELFGAGKVFYAGFPCSAF